jgi:hypothetical protein
MGNTNNDGGAKNVQKKEVKGGGSGSGSSGGVTLNKLLLKIKYSFYSALVFFLFANPKTHDVLQQILHRYITVTEPSGALTVNGFFLSTGLFFVTILGMMLLPQE